MSTVVTIFKDTMRVLLSESVELRELAQLTTIDPFVFYEGADLRGLDLSGQDLRGLSFTKADLRNTRLDDIKFDAGSFNNANIDSLYSDLKDEYKVTILELLDLAAFPQWLYCWADFRPGFIDAAIEIFGVTYSWFASQANIHTATLYKARQGNPVTKDTARGIASAILALTTSDRSEERPRIPWLQRPALRIISHFNMGVPMLMDSETVARYQAAGRSAAQAREKLD